MQYDKISYTLDYNISKVYDEIFDTRKQIVFRNEKLIENELYYEKNKILRYFLEDRDKKINVSMKFFEIDNNKTRVEIECEIKKRVVIFDVLSFLIIDVKKELNEYIRKLEVKLNGI